MEYALLILVGLFLVVVAPIWALIGMSNLKRRVETLERQMIMQAQQPPAPATTQPDVSEPSVAPPTAPVGPPAPQRAAADGPWVTSAKAPPPPPSAPPPGTDETPGRFVVTSARIGQLTTWLRENWIIAVAAISLALTGVFFVQYGIENGILSPRLRVLSAIGFGLALIAGGEVMRRRLGDDHDLAAFIPSALSGAGLVAIFAGVLSARQLYGLIGPTTAFAGMSVTALAAIALGWFYGPFLIAFGILGATAAPFLVGGDSNDPWILMYYFALIVGAGLTVDALKRSAWISVIAVVAPSIAAWLIWAGTSVGAQHIIAYSALLTVMAIALPLLSIRPTHAGSPVIHAALNFRAKPVWPEFPTRVATGAAAIAIGFSIQVSATGETEFWLALTFLTALFAATVFWLRNAPALEDIALYAGLAIVGIIGMSGLGYWSATRTFLTTVVEPEGAVPLTMTILTGLGIGLSVLASIAVFTGRHWAWGFGAALIAPAIVILLDLFWGPLTHLARPTWALHGVAVAAVMTYGAIQSRDRMPNAPLTTAIFAIAAMTMLGFACVVLLTETALTLAFAVLAVAAAWLDRRFDLAPLTLFVKLAALAISFRLVIDPGVPWAIDAPWFEVLAMYAGTVLLLAVAWVLLAARERNRTQMVTESVAASMVAIGFTVLLLRILADGTGIENHWGMSLFATVWLISALGQLYRARAGFRRLRFVLASIFALFGLILLGVGVTIFNPVSGFFATNVVGPPIFDSLAAAYLIPALIFAATYYYFPELHRLLRLAVLGLASVLGALWIGLEIRRLWRGPDLSQPGVTDPEMYSYTIALIALSAILLAAALFRRSAVLRKLGLAAAGIAVAKVFLLDASGLTGLTRVFSFLALGLALAGLAMVNRWIMRLQSDDDRAAEAEAPAD